MQSGLRPLAHHVNRNARLGPRVRLLETWYYVRERARSGYHPVGSCKIGSDDMAVVDSQLRVRGVDGLRVADSSNMPRLVSGNTNAPSIMIGENASDLIRGNRVLADDKLAS